ncbi:SSI family serine proteinase inhibitor [Micromonospora endolithica]|uniref:Proteinase inhibitor I4 serpin n=1 Tax=Micromonospora endolithica TaxID=230091 RepID=A0A3A9YRC5_9ACTN|nr:SSI family serine proteinase inhibitor [Micromonospora endolithica]RKN37816.1 proteinase inhibitor I4 serpin [Micromonospora endolithica]TWJ22171.1 subtilisin inhibitor-like [Micromonospora endolithica]
MPFAQRIAALTTATLVATGALAAPAAHAATPRPAPTSVLLLSVVGHTDGSLRTAALRCEPAGGGHPHAAAACGDVAAVDGDLAALAVDPGLCTLEYAPVTVRAVGLWRDHPLSYVETFDNRCQLLRETGTLFAF